MKFAKFLRTSIFKNICERLPLFVSPQNTITTSGGEFGPDETSSECILFNQLQLYNLYVSLHNSGSARFLNSNFHLVSEVATMSLRNRLAYSGNSA